MPHKERPAPAAVRSDQERPRRRPPRDLRKSRRRCGIPRRIPLLRSPRPAHRRARSHSRSVSDSWCGKLLSRPEWPCRRSRRSRVSRCCKARRAAHRAKRCTLAFRLSSPATDAPLTEFQCPDSPLRPSANRPPRRKLLLRRRHRVLSGNSLAGIRCPLASRVRGYPRFPS